MVEWKPAPGNVMTPEEKISFLMETATSTEFLVVVGGLVAIGVVFVARAIAAPRRRIRRDPLGYPILE